MNTKYNKYKKLHLVVYNFVLLCIFTLSGTVYLIRFPISEESNYSTTYSGGINKNLST